MTNYNLIWDICEVYWNRRFPAPVEYADDHIGNSRTNLRQLPPPGAMIQYRTPYRVSPMIEMLGSIGRIKEIKEYDDSKRGLFYGTKWEEETLQADLQAEEAFKKSQAENVGDAFQTRLQSLYPTLPESHGYLFDSPSRMDDDTSDED